MGKLSTLEMRVDPEATATSNEYNAQGFIGAPHKARDYHEAEEDLEVTEEDDKAALKTRVVQKSARRRL
ncbi:hypothetical protein K469DRAFT_704601 [Zopfia rhizophila CBS 207.26]|uniref:Uncharacterized protein n=1 Tax=Zopfia rhizophila CBS 207.26 TaxID=1314779 RepID=A0A6A6DM72_9PEZI|nr:hypothetical protein K469DRAFT_716266 [Zopfia rhizophila CBS 207.26]KAF2180676.1 hypothetical protein K469DRAFT_714698 [Zopfia rhizophila CBS 207.26]KAF2187666.1 hypothetical protein K469DRAFT_704601 [Zopfia rhizophila CBS 207.26]